jgi:hypothetical protein
VVSVFGGGGAALELGSVLYPVVGGVGAWIVALAVWFAVIGITDHIVKKAERRTGGGAMGIYSWLHRRSWKSAVVLEIHKKHGLNIRAIGDLIGPGALEDVLDAQYELTAGPPEAGALNVERLLSEKYGINFAALKLEALAAQIRDG